MLRNLEEEAEAFQGGKIHGRQQWHPIRDVLLITELWTDLGSLSNSDRLIKGDNSALH